MNTVQAGSAGVAQGSITYTDDEGAQTQSTANLALATLGNIVQETHFVRAVAGQPVSFAVAVSGVLGSPQYDLMVDVLPAGTIALLQGKSYSVLKTDTPGGVPLNGGNNGAADIPDLSVAPAPPVDTTYLLAASIWGAVDNNAYTWSVSVSVDGTDQGEELYAWDAGESSRKMVTLTVPVTLTAGAHTVKLRAHAHIGYVTVAFSTRSLILVPLG